MNLDIGGNLRRLRNKRDITQEELANYIGVSFQAVSKWERGEGYPDITFILPLASYFGVSTDELLGMKSEKEEKEINEIMERANLFVKDIHFFTDENRHLFSERINILAEGYKKFPNNFKLMVQYAMSLQYDYRIDETDFLKLQKRSFEANGDEIEQISRRVLQECTDTELRHSASVFLIRVYAYRGERDKAIGICNTFPLYPTSQNIMKTNIYDYYEDALPQYRKVFFELFHSLIIKINSPFKKSKDEMRICWKKTIKLCDVFFDDEEYGSLAGQVIAACLNYSMDFDSNPDRSLAYIRKAFEAAKHEDGIVKHRKNYVYQSFLVQGVDLEPEKDFSFTKDITEVQNVINTLELRKEKDEPRIKALIEEYTPYSGVRNV
ncbi:MAG: helix-turn-helix domain-containing protein [Oscillospiraceae bacterium]|nr:helix-turn-helix domain-containing protein [Oscillospiraceae bacterium]